MDYKIYHNCLRVQITNDDMQDERIENIAEHCAKYGIDNVMLTINQEEFNVGHITIELAKPWVAVLKKAKRALEEKGISVSLNNWIEIGHCDRGRPLFEGQNFQTFVDVNGRAAESVACPLCENWRKYFAEYATYLIKELSPDTFWLEDDFRLHNHSPLKGVGCFCPLHMKYYNEKLGTNYTREQFVEKVFAKGPINPEREVWLNANRDVMFDLAEFMNKTVKSANPDTDIAVMSSRPIWHCMEGRNWNKLLDILGRGGHRINRIHLPYNEITGKEFMYNLNIMSLPVRSLADDDVIVMPEIEHGAATLYNKSARFLRFTLEASTPLVLSGTTYSIYDFIANGARESFGFGKVISDLQPYMQGIRDLNLEFSKMQGVVIPVDQNASYYKTIEKDDLDLTPTEYHAGAYLSGLGIAYKYSTEKEFNEKTLFMTASNLDYFTDEMLKTLFANNFIILDASAVISLSKRNLLSLISADKAEIMKGDTGVFSYEECERDDVEICGVRKLRASARRVIGDSVKVDYNKEVTIHTKLYNHFMEEAANGFTAGENFAVLPFFVTEYRYPLFADLRKYFLSKVITEQKSEYVVFDEMGISPYLYKRENDYVLIAVNGNVDTFDNICFKIDNVKFTRIFMLDKKGSLVEAPYEYKDSKVQIDMPFEYMSSLTLIFE